MAFYTSADIVEKLNFLWSSLILLLFALSIGALRYLYLSSLISCWTPAQFTNGYTQYTLQACWNQNTSNLPMENDVPQHFGSGNNQVVTYHSFIPVIVVLMIIGFKIPEAVKFLLDLCTGSKLKSSVAVTDSWKERSESLAECGRDIVQRSGIVKTLSFFLVQILVLINLIAQFSFIQIFCRDNMISNGVNNSTVNIFPKNLLCDFDIRQFQNVKNFMVQCQMPVNTLYEVFFRLFGFWILGVGLLAGAMFLFQIGTLMIPKLVGIRFREIIPEKDLNSRGFSVDDALLFLEEVKDEYGIAMARSVASKMWQNPTMIRNEAMVSVPHTVNCETLHQTPRNENNSGDGSSVYPLLERPTTSDINARA